MALSPPAKVGIATIASVAAIAGGLSWLTNFSFRPSGFDFEVVYHDVSGLMPGANVMLMGVKVGKITAVVPQDDKVLVKVHIADINTKIGRRSRFKIMSPGIVGEKAIEIFPPRKLADVRPVAAPTPTPMAGNATPAANPTPDLPGGTAAAMSPAPVAVATSTPLGAATAPPQAEVAPQYIANGDIATGDDPTRMELVMEELTATFEEFKKSSDPKKFQELFNKTAENLYQTTETVKRIGIQAEKVVGGLENAPPKVNAFLDNLNKLTKDIDSIAKSANPQDIAAISRDVRQLSNGLLLTYKNMFGTNTAQVNDKTLATARNMVGQLDRLATTLNQAASDPVVQGDIKDTLKNIRDLTARVTEATALAQPKTLGGFSVHPRLQGVAANTPTGTGLAGNLGLRVNLADNYLAAGIEQVGEGNFFNLNFGDEEIFRGVGYHFGLVRSKIGVGVDYSLTKEVSLLGQFYDPFTPTIRLGSSYYPIAGTQYGIMAQWARTIAKNENYFWAGVEWRPAN